MDTSKLDRALESHASWLKSEGGERASLGGANLRGADLRRADLRRADLEGADLEGANLRGANLRGANLRRADLEGADLEGAYLRGAYLRGAYLEGANLRRADLEGADLEGADLRGADLRGANLEGANLRGAKLPHEINVCPPDGSFTAWKACRYSVIVKLLIPSDAKRSNATSRKCRASKAEVVAVFGAEVGVSKHDPRVQYRAGDTVVAHEFDDNRWVECSGGIHFFMSREEAEEWL